MIKSLTQISISYVLTIIGLLYIVNVIILYYNASTLSIFLGSSLIGLYLFACMISKNRYDNFMVEPREISFTKFIKIVFLPSILFSSIFGFFFSNIIDEYSIIDIINIAYGSLDIFIKHSNEFILILPLFIGIVALIMFKIVIYWCLMFLYIYIINLFNLFLLSNIN